MLIEHRSYQLQTSAAERYFTTLGRRGMELQTRHLGNCVGHYVTEIGSHSQVIAIWEHESFESRAAGRRQLYECSEWRDIVGLVSPVVRDIDIKLLVRSPLWQGNSSDPAR